MTATVQRPSAGPDADDRRRVDSPGAVLIDVAPNGSAKVVTRGLLNSKSSNATWGLLDTTRATSTLDLGASR